jgi:hypothetical protein
VTTDHALGGTQPWRRRTAMMGAPGDLRSYDASGVVGHPIDPGDRHLPPSTSPGHIPAVRNGVAYARRSGSVPDRGHLRTAKNGHRLNRGGRRTAEPGALLRLCHPPTILPGDQVLHRRAPERSYCSPNLSAAEVLRPWTTATPPAPTDSLTSPRGRGRRPLRRPVRSGKGVYRPSNSQSPCLPDRGRAEALGTNSRLCPSVSPVYPILDRRKYSGGGRPAADSTPS